MRTGTWSYDIDAGATPAAALALLSDITQQGQLHPLITKVEQLPPAEGALRSYAVTDRLRLGPIPFRITYFADTLSITDDEVVTVARQKPRTTIRNRTTITATDGGVHVHVDVELTAPTPLFSYAFREGRKAHLELAARIRRVLDASQG
ncbi:MAG: hypothetical protein ABR549_00490 [Mycobacteriales bacterium]